MKAHNGKAELRESGPGGRLLLGGNDRTQIIPWLCGAAWAKGISLPALKAEVADKPRPVRSSQNRQDFRRARRQ